MKTHVTTITFGNRKGQMVEFTRSRDRLMLMMRFERQNTFYPVVHQSDNNGYVGVGQEGGNVLDVIMRDEEFKQIMRIV